MEVYSCSGKQWSRGLKIGAGHTLNNNLFTPKHDLREQAGHILLKLAAKYPE